MAKRLYYEALARSEKVVSEARNRLLSGMELKRYQNGRVFHFGPRELRKFARGFYVYLWKRASEVLYVGSTKNVASRIANHHAVGIKEPFGEADRIEVRTFGSALEMLAEELRLIRELRPKYNVANLESPIARPEPKHQRYRRSGPNAKTLWLADCVARARKLHEGDHARAQA